MDRDWTNYGLIALGAVLLWLLARRGRAGDAPWRRMLPVAIAVALVVGIALHLRDRM
ncbi:hypothetical protein KAJ83_09990 [Marivibrio halodurans]|uniref:Uncharacterized protein n=1 Tax=Marivibrio halodurans TaxID=2039722 RepID=A0A8J7S2F8_9PROT|nr:hypothetical protein [Marivibrio halodurans]MBP5857338.1 hypothetical protein [Marivibrio halodurans]